VFWRLDNRFVSCTTFSLFHFSTSLFRVLLDITNTLSNRKMWMYNILIAALFVKVSHSLEEQLILSKNGIASDSVAGRALMASAQRVNSEVSRVLEDEEWDKETFLPNYAIKFQSCHSVSEWNGSSNTDSDNDSKIVTKNLVRFRLCNSKTCSNSSSKGCTSQYGDYVVELNTFAYYFLSAQSERNSEISQNCLRKCGSANDCYYECFSEKGGFSIEDSNINPLNYVQCASYGNYYIGPVCSSSGDQINLGIFDDESCSTPSSCDKSCFYKTYSFKLPYTSQSMIPNSCLSCSSSNNGGTGCTSIYETSGKCEMKLPIDYPNDSACTFIEGIRRSKFGAIRGVEVKNKVASVVIGLLTFSTILLGFYSNFVWKKFQRAKFNLSKENYVALDY